MSLARLEGLKSVSVGISREPEERGSRGSGSFVGFQRDASGGLRKFREPQGLFMGPGRSSGVLQGVSGVSHGVLVNLRRFFMRISGTALELPECL